MSRSPGFGRAGNRSWRTRQRQLQSQDTHQPGSQASLSSSVELAADLPGLHELENGERNQIHGQPSASRQGAYSDGEIDPWPWGEFSQDVKNDHFPAVADRSGRSVFFHKTYIESGSQIIEKAPPKWCQMTGHGVPSRSRQAVLNSQRIQTQEGFGKNTPLWMPW